MKKKLIEVALPIEARIRLCSFPLILAIGQVDGGQQKLVCIRRPFQQEPDFAVESINYNLQDLLAKGELPK